jgi:putative restriction endonuclease
MDLGEQATATLAAAKYALQEAERAGGTVSLAVLRAFEHRGVALPIAEIRGGRGIRKPAGWDLPLSVRSVRNSRYYDAPDPSGGALLYARQENREGATGRPDAYNRSLTKAMEQRHPFIHLWESVPGYYLVSWPTFVVGEDVATGFVTLAFGEGLSRTEHTTDLRMAAEPVPRRYVLREHRVRLHQAQFRDTVLEAYRTRCCICRLGHRGLLDAAHIVDDADAGGHAVVSNGLALCRIHHGAYDQFLLGVTPDLRIDVNQRILDEIDGPMLRHGLQEMHGEMIELPNDERLHPERDRLAWKYERFRLSSTS